MGLTKKKKAKGYILLETVLAMIAFGLLAMSFFTIFSGQFSMINSSRDALQAQQYAEIDAQKIRLMNYYDLDDEGAKSRSAMTSWSNPGDIWEDEITVGNEVIIDDYNQSKQRIAHIKIYRKNDTLARFEMDVPVSSQGSGTPIGGVISWPTDSMPEYDGGTYLECDGSTFDTTKFKQLYEVLGTNKLPDYRGMFLRGYGTRTIDGIDRGIQNPSATVTFSTGNVGEVQGDAFPDFFVQAMAHENPFDDPLARLNYYREALGFPIHKSLGPCSLVYENAGGATFWLLPYISESDFISLFPTRSYSQKSVEPLSKFLSDPFGVYKYELSGENLIETGPYDIFSKFSLAPINIYQPTWSTTEMMAQADEIRPVNVAVRYLIKAK